MNEFGDRHHAIVLATLRRIGNGTFYEIAHACELTPQQVWRRMSELYDKKLIRRLLQEDGTPHTREGDTGRQCCVWAIVRPEGERPWT